jgi:hypothetical protein
MNQLFLSFVLSLISIFSCYSLAAEVKITTDPQTKLKGWKFNQNDMELELIQRLPDQTRGFFLGRGFSTEIVNDIANACVFQTIVRNTGANTGAKPISVSLKKWQVVHNEKTTPLKLKEDWNRQWAKANVRPSAKLAFRWATFPTEQTFHPSGDYNWGMISFGLSPGALFDLNLQWVVGDKTYKATIKNIQCAQDQ